MADNLKIRIIGTLNTGATISEINTALKGIEKKISAIKLNVQIDDKVSKTLADFSKAMENHKKIATDLNRIIKEEKTVTKEADGTIREKIRQHLKSGEIIEKEIKRTNDKIKATQQETRVIEEQNKAIQRQGELLKNKYQVDAQGNKTLKSQTYREGNNTTTYNTQTGTATSVKNVEQERVVTQQLSQSKQALKQALQQLNNEGKVSAENLAKLNKAIDNSKNIQQVQRLQQNLENLKRIRDNEHKLEMARQQAQVNAQRIRTTHGGFVDNAALNQYTQSVDNLTPRTANLNQQLQRSSAQFTQVAQNARSAAGAAQQAGMSFGEMLSTAMTKFPIWMISATAFYAPIRALEDMTSRLIEIDTLMVNIQRVMDMPDFKFTQLLEDAVQVSDELSSKLTDVLSIMGDFGRMGFKENELIDISSTAQVLQNISDLDANAAVDTLTSAMLNFNIAAKDSITIADQLNEIDNNFAVTTKDLSDGLRKSASTAKTFGVEMSDLVGYIAAIGSTTRESGNIIGNGLKTIMSRITTMSEAETALSGVNIAIKDMGGNVRPVSAILQELAGKWTGLNDEQRQNLGVTLAGRYQLSRFLALMNNFSIATDATAMAMDSQGSSMREQAKYADSLEGRINRLDTAWNKLTLSAGSAVMTDGLIAVVETLNDIATISSKAIDTFGLLSGVFGTLGVATVLLSTRFRTFTTSLIFGTAEMTRAQLATAGLSAGMSRLGIATVGATAAFRGLVASTGVGLIFVGLGFAIEKLIGLYSDARQKQEEFEDSQKKNIEALTTNKQRTEELVNSYKKLSAQKNGDNWNNDKEKEYLQIQQQLGEIFPNLIEEMDATGQYRLKAAEDIDKEVQATKELLELKREETRLNALSTFEENIGDREGFLGLEKRVEAKRKQLEDMAKHDFKQSYVNQVKQELLQLENELAQSSLKINDEVLKVAEAYNKLDIDPTISKNIQDFVNSLNLSEIDDPAKLEAYSIEISKFTDAMQQAYESGDETGFDKARNSLTSYAQKMGATKVEAESLDISFKKVKEENDRLANATYAGADGMGALETAMDGVGDSADKLAKSYDDAISNIESLNGIINDLNENHAVSADTISTMMEKYPELLAYIDDEAKLREEVNKLINAENDIALDAISKKLEGNEQYFTKIKKANNDLVNTLAKGYNVDLTNTKTLAQFKASINANLIKKLGSDWATYYDVQTRTFTAAGRKMMETMSYAEAANSPQLRAISEYEASMKSLTESLRSITAGSGFGNIDSSGLKDVASSTSKAYENATYVSDKFKIAIENVNFELERQNQLQSKFPKHSKQYQDSIKKEIALMKQKKKLLEDQARSLDGQIKSGNIQQTGMIKGSSGGSSGSYSSGTYNGKYAKEIMQASAKYDVDPFLIAAIIQAESSFNPNARSHAGARGLMQLMPATAKELGVSNSYDPLQNIMGGTKYIAQQISRFGGDIKKALWAYNAGAGNVSKILNSGANSWKGVKAYADKILTQFNATNKSISSASKSVADYYLNNFRVTSQFNENRGSYNHKGLDLANGRQGDPVKALNNGKVITAAYSKSAGYWVVVQQDDGTVAKYMHMQKGLNVKAGQRVTAGQQLGKVGNTGQSTGAHLHLQIESGGKPVDPQTYMQQLSATTSSTVADQMQLIDQAKSELIDLKMDALDIENQIAQLQMELINSQLAQYDLVVRQIQSHLKIYQANQNKYLESQSEYYKGNLQSQINLLTNQRKVYQDEMKYISDQVRLNKGLTEAQKSELEAKLLDVRDAFYDVHTQVRALEWEKTLASLARYGDEVEKLDYKLRLSKQQQELYNKTSQEYIDLQGHQKRYHHEKIVAMEREKAMIDQVRASQNLDEQQKKELNDRYLELKVSILEAQDAMQELANEASQLKLDNVLKQIEKVSDELSRQLDKIDDSIHMADPEDEEAILKLNRDRLNVLLKQRKAILDNIESLNAIRKELAGNDEALQQNAEEIQKWKDSLSDIDVSIFDQKKSIEDIYESIADSYIEAMKEAYDAEREIKLKQLDDIRKREEKAHNEKMRELDEQSKALDKQYDKQLRALDDQEASDDYEKDLTNKQSEAQKLQDKINALAMDDSEWAKKERLRLEEELAEQLEAIEELKNDRALALRRQALQDERDAKQEQIDAEREMENEAWETRQEELDKQREQIEQFYEDLLEDEREWAKIREDIMSGNINYYKDKLTEMAKYVTDNGKILGDSISQNIADALNRAKENISAISESIKKLFKDVGNTTAKQDKNAADTASKREKDEVNQPEKNKTGKIIIKKPIKLWTRKNGKLEYVRGLNPGEVYRVYGYDDKWGGQYNVGKNHWVTNMPQHVQFQQFRSGGYTGNDEGLAMLHEKELVLNKEDTKNMLESVKLLRSMVKIPDLTSILGGLKLATSQPSIVYDLDIHIGTVTGDKNGGKAVFDEVVKGLKKIGK